VAPQVPDTDGLKTDTDSTVLGKVPWLPALRLIRPEDRLSDVYEHEVPDGRYTNFVSSTVGFDRTTVHLKKRGFCQSFAR
jgi:hypothetical protein